MSTTIVVCGALANKPGNGGEAWVRISWIRGLLGLGFDAHFLEVISPEAWGNDDDAGLSHNVAYFKEVVESMGLADRSTLMTTAGETLAGPPKSDLERVLDQTALLINISGHASDPDLLARFPRRAYVDLDPGYTQHWHDQGQLGSALAEHDTWFTVGLNVGSPQCRIPTGGYEWRPVMPPVVLADWPVVTDARHGAFTTVGSWRGGFGALDVDGRRLGQKAHEWRKFVDLPALLETPVEAALKIHSSDDADRRQLEEHGWRLVDPDAVVATPQDFRQYVADSLAELSVAQEVYVETNSGWFSDRTVRYLASGKPALVQETGASNWLPTGEGLLTFRDPEEAAAGARLIESDYERHSRAARRLAEEYFSSERVLPAFLSAAGVA